jgi:hypothetical protein
MKSTFKSRLRLTSLAPLAAVAFAGMSGCAGVESEPAPVDQGQAAPSESAVVEYLLHVQPSKGKITAHRLTKAALALESAHGPGFSPQAMIDAALKQDGVVGSNSGSTTNNTVELVTAGTTDTFGTGAVSTGCSTSASSNVIPCCAAGSFCANVTLNSFWTRALNNTFVVVTSLTDSSGIALSGHSGSNSDSPRTTGLSSSFGLWMYQSPSVSSAQFSNGNSGVMLPGTANGATKTWAFANPDDADTYIRLAVNASKSYASYSLGTSLAYVANDACTGGTNLGALNANFTKTLPFSFTFWGTTTTQVNFNKWGMASFGNSAGAALLDSSIGTNSTKLDTNQTLPSTAVQSPHPGAFIFWDSLRWPSGSTPTPKGLCYKTTGTAPNQQAVITWKNVGFSGTGPYMTFTMILNESSDEIWYQYDAMAGSGSATLGAQDETGTVIAAGSGPVTTVTAGLRKILLPLP